MRSRAWGIVALSCWWAVPVAQAQQVLQSPPNAFVENRGQWQNGSLFQMRRGNSIVAVGRDGFTIQMLRLEADGTRKRRPGATSSTASVFGWNVGLRFVGSSPAAQVEGLDELPGDYNWLIGNDRS